MLYRRFMRYDQTNRHKRRRGVEAEPGDDASEEAEYDGSITMATIDHEVMTPVPPQLF